MLRRVEAAVNSNQRESQKRRVPVQKLLDQFKSSVEAHRFASIKVRVKVELIPIGFDFAMDDQETSRFDCRLRRDLKFPKLDSKRGHLLEHLVLSRYIPEVDIGMIVGPKHLAPNPNFPAIDIG
jgi:hypothetical protein